MISTDYMMQVFQIAKSAERYAGAEAVFMTADATALLAMNAEPDLAVIQAHMRETHDTLVGARDLVETLKKTMGPTF